MGFLDYFRDSSPKEFEASEQVGSPSAEIEQLRQEVEESHQASRELVEYLDDVSFSLLGTYAALNQYDDTKHADRVRQMRVNWAYYRDNESVRRAVNLINEFTWGRGFQKPVAVDPRVQRVIDSMWLDEDNNLIVFSLDAQLKKGVELTNNGEIFLLIFDQGEWEDLGIEVKRRVPDGRPEDQDVFSSALSESRFTEEASYSYIQDLTGGAFDVEIIGDLPPSAVKIAQIHPAEINHIVRDDENAAKPRYYRREFFKRRYNFATDEYEQDPNPTVLYYEDLLCPPNQNQPKPPTTKIGDGKIYHLAINTDSFVRRGNADTTVMIRWARSLNDYFKWRLTFLRALNTFPFKRKITGGPSAVAQAALRIANGGLPLPVQNGEYNPLPPPAPGSIITENESESLEQFKTDPQSSSAQTDISTLRSMMATAAGLSSNYLNGGADQATLSNSTIGEVPVIKRLTLRQEILETMMQILFEHGINKAISEGRIPEDADHSFKCELPNILERNIPELVNAINNIASRVDPYSINFKLKRWLLLQGLTYLGVHNPQTVVNTIYPPEAEQREEARLMALASPMDNPDAPATTPELEPSSLDPFKNTKQMARTADNVGEAMPTETELKENAALYEVSLQTLLKVIEEIGKKELESLS